LEGGVFDELPKLQAVVTTLAIGGVLMADGFGDGHLIRRDAPELTRRHVYVETMGINPAAVGAMIELLGADQVLAGTDWPIAVERYVSGRLQKALTIAGLSAEQQQAVVIKSRGKPSNLWRWEIYRAGRSNPVCCRQSFSRGLVPPRRRETGRLPSSSQGVTYANDDLTEQTRLGFKATDGLDQFVNLGFRP
jgi:hypothetical protein